MRKSLYGGTVEEEAGVKTPWRNNCVVCNVRRERHCKKRQFSLALALSLPTDRCENAARLYAFIILLVQETRGGVKVGSSPPPPHP